MPGATHTVARPALPERLIATIGGNAAHPETITGTSAEQKDDADRCLMLEVAQ